MKASIATYITLVACLLLAACGNSKPAVSTAQQQEALAPQKSQVWQLVAMRGKAVSRTDNIITLMFNPEAGTVSGKATCNSYYGNYRLRLDSQTPEGDNYTLKLSDVGSTKVYCNEADMNAESRYISLLPKADALRIDAYTLTLYQKGKEILKYELQ
jgi:heat shock protein HslJ